MHLTYQGEIFISRKDRVFALYYQISIRLIQFKTYKININMSTIALSAPKTVIPKSTVFGTANWFSRLEDEQKLLVSAINTFAVKAKLGYPSDDIELDAQKWLYDWAFEQISSKVNDWQNCEYTPIEFQIDEVANGDAHDCLTLFYRYGDSDNEDHAYLKIFLI